MSDYLDEQTKKLQELYNSQMAQQLAQAQYGRDNELNSLERQLKEGLPGYQTQRNQADYNYATDAQRSKELMAAMGAFNSGDNVNMQGRLFTNRQNAFNQINGDQNTFTTGINNKKNDVTSNYVLSESNIKNTIAAQLAQALQTLNEQERARQLQIEEAEKQRQFQMAEAEKQRQFQAQQAALSRSSGGSGGNSSSSKETYTNNVRNAFSDVLNNGGTGDAYAWLHENKDDIIDATSQQEYNNLVALTGQVQNQNTKNFRKSKSQYMGP